ncbi:hypothetical protein LTR95_004993 [Oleoguttula sp. CCFEE 5521]
MGDQLLHALLGHPFAARVALNLSPSASSGSQYPSTQMDLDRLLPTESPLKRPFDAPLSHREALATFLRNLQAPDGRSSEIVAVLETWNCLPKTWDLPFKMFNELDQLFFGHQLQGRVVLCWNIFGDADRNPIGTTHSSPTAGRARIELRLDLDWDAFGRDQILATLLHEMLHAYFFVMCGNANDLADPDWESVKGHGEFWQVARKEIESITGLALIKESRSRIFTGSEIALLKTQRSMKFVIEFLGWEKTPQTQGRFRDAAVERGYSAIGDTDIWVPDIA